MIFRIVLLELLITLIAVNCHDSGSAEVNKIEITPFYESIIFSDLADIFNELENGMNPLETFLNSASDSEENLEDLLFEYQHYLDRAHNQRLNYLEKTKTKNKVPLKRHDRFSKAKPVGNTKYDNYFYSGSYLNANKPPMTQYGNPLDVFMPVGEKKMYMANLNSALQKEEGTLENRLPDLSLIIPKSRYDPIKPSCFCKNTQLPCDCKCKQCFIYDEAGKNYYPYSKYFSGDNEKAYFPNAGFASEDKLSDDNTLNIRIKVDIQLPKTKDIFTKLIKNRSHEELSSKETSVTVPFPYYNFPIPLDLLGFKTPSKANSHDSTHKITIQKKKKNRSNNGNKKHRKKLIAFHNFNIKPHMKIQPYYDEITNTTIDYNENKKENSSRTLSYNTIVSTTQLPESLNNIKNATETASNNKDNLILNNETQIDESFYVTVNISNNSDNLTEDIRRTENSVETDFTKIDKIIPTEKVMLRKKRDISTSKPLTTTENIKTKPELVTKNISSSNFTSPSLPKSNIDNKKSDKFVVADSELEYWPINKNLTDYTSKNITTIILGREDKKSKLNMTKEAMRNNRSTILEKAIFGDVNWDDVDTVAPVFLSFVGKYIRGVLTFCSQNVCHSMKCEQKTCVHRICHPSDRWNQRGHCAGSNKTDSIASLESIMDLPSNVAFEIVDILQDKMLGKIFGKVTLCINSKCITFIAIKKSFLKSKCSMKDLKIGHCPNMKNSKIM